MAVGSTTVTVGDSRGLTRDVGVRVAYDAGTVVSALQLRVTGDPASANFLRSAAIEAAEAAATQRPGSRIYVPTDAVAVHAALPADDRCTTIDVPVQITGRCLHQHVNATTHVAVRERMRCRASHRAVCWSAIIPSV